MKRTNQRDISSFFSKKSQKDIGGTFTTNISSSQASLQASSPSIIVSSSDEHEETQVTPQNQGEQHVEASTSPWGETLIDDGRLSELDVINLPHDSGKRRKMSDFHPDDRDIDDNSPGGDAFVGAGYRAWNKVEAFDKHVGGHMSAHNQALGRDVCWLFGDVLAPLLNFVGGSPKRKEFLQEKQAETVVEALSSGDLESGTSLNQELGLSRPGDTRWGSHFKTILNVISLYPSILESLDAIGEVSDWNDTNKAESLTHLMMSFDFIFVAHLMLSIFGITNELNLALQKKKRTRHCECDDHG
ncbi:hypothetical protein V6N13_006279 [Hibiscus sabdariffa]